MNHCGWYKDTSLLLSVSGGFFLNPWLLYIIFSGCAGGYENYKYVFFVTLSCISVLLHALSLLMSFRAKEETQRWTKNFNLPLVASSEKGNYTKFKERHNTNPLVVIIPFGYTEVCAILARMIIIVFFSYY